MKYAVACDGVEPKAGQVDREFRCECIVAPADEEVEVVDGFLDVVRRDPLQGEFRPVAVMDAVVPSLEECLEVVFHMRDGCLFGVVLVGGGQRPVVRCGDPEHAALRVSMQDKRLDRVNVQDLVFISEKVVEELLDLLEREDVLFFDELPSGHPPTPALVPFAEHGHDGNFQVVQAVRERHRGLDAFRA